MKITAKSSTVIIVILITNLSLIYSQSLAQKLTWIGSIPGKGNSRASSVSDDGSVIAMMCYNTFDPVAYKWTLNQGLVELDRIPSGVTSEARGISSDGSIICGSSDSNFDKIHSVRWDKDGLHRLGFLYDYQKDSSIAYGISADGSVMVGSAKITRSRSSAFRWTEGSGMVELGSFGSSSRAEGISGDGNVVVGEAFDTTQKRWAAFRWTQSEGMQHIDTVTSLFSSEATCISSNGNVIAGQAQFTQNLTHAFRCVATSGMIEDIGTLPAYPEGSGIWAMSEDGKIMVGWSGKRINPKPTFHAVVWTSGSGIQDLNAIYSNLLDNGSYLQEASGISRDGRYIVGNGIDGLTGSTRGFILDTKGENYIEDRKQKNKVELDEIIEDPLTQEARINFFLPAAMQVSFYIYDLLGRKVSEINLNQITVGANSIQFSTKNLKAGAYMCVVQTGKEVSEKAFILLH